MTVYPLVLLTHVLAAVLGLGLVTATALAARPAVAAAPSLVLSLVRGAQITLGVVFLTGGALNWVAGGGFAETWWFRLAAISLVVTGVAVAYARRVATRWRAGGLEAASARTRIARSSWVAVALVAWIVALMELRPFG